MTRMVLLLRLVPVAGFATEDLHSLAACLSTLARISLVGRTQSIGMELQPSVEQISLLGLVGRAPPVI
jgi:hypothetical protein